MEFFQQKQEQIILKKTTIAHQDRIKKYLIMKKGKIFSNG
jgi:hypothetical protein